MKRQGNPQGEATPTSFFGVVEYLERVFIFVLVLSILLTLLGVEFNLITNLSLGGLGLILFLSAFKRIDIPPPTDQKLLQEGSSGLSDLLGLTIVPKVLFMCMSFGIFGILLSRLNTGNDGYLRALSTGALGILLCILILVILKLKGTKYLEVNLPIVARGLVVFLAIVYIWSIQ